MDYLRIDADTGDPLIAVQKAGHIGRWNSCGLFILREPVVHHLGNFGVFADENEDRGPGFLPGVFPLAPKLLPQPGQHRDGVMSVLTAGRRRAVPGGGHAANTAAARVWSETLQDTLVTSTL